jgi:ribonuclease E
VTLAVIADPTVNGQQSYIIDRGEQVHTLEAAKALLAAQLAASPPQAEEAYDDDEPFEIEAEIETDETEGLASEQAAGEGGESDSDGRKRKRRRRRRGRSGEARDGVAARDDDGSDNNQAGDAAEAAGVTDDAEASDETGDQDAEARADGSADGERRPRRRGRRGGRRRRGNGNEGGLAGSIADELAPTSEPEVTEAVADFDSAPPLSEQQVHVDNDEARARAGQSPTPQPEAPSSAPAHDETAAEPEKAARRRSTVREKVSFTSQPDPASAGEAQAEPPAPAQPEQPESEVTEASQPRRAGWWSRRFGNGT